MPSPFPGMDPYLEDPAYWHGMHNRLIFCASEALNIGLPPGYVADIKETWVVSIRTANKPRRIVTIIEVLSPANKAAGSVGRREYAQKQQEILQSETNLLEIDLLRQGMPTAAVPLPLLKERGIWDYLACLHRSAQRYQYGYGLNRVREPLPLVRVPLMNGEPDTVLDLQAVFDRAYDSGRYQQEIDYRETLTDPFSAEDTAWMDALLRAKGVRFA